jgi:hypothetical protein
LALLFLEVEERTTEEVPVPPSAIASAASRMAWTAANLSCGVLEEDVSASPPYALKLPYRAKIDP